MTASGFAHVLCCGLLVSLALAGPAVGAVPAPVSGAAHAPDAGAAPATGAVPISAGGSTSAAIGPATGPPAAAADAGPRIVGVYPNPVAPEDAGEFVLVRWPDPTANRSVVLTDGETTHHLEPPPNGTTVVVSTAPDRTRSLLEGLSSPYDAPVRAAEMALANGGETLTLRHGADPSTSTVAQTIGYDDAAAGEVYRPSAEGWGWAPLGRPSLAPAAGGAGSAQAFVLPDSPAVPLAPIRAAENRVLVAGYTLTSGRVAAALVAAAERGVDVRVLLEGDPVGGLSARAARQLDRLVAAGVAVRLVGGPRARYRYHHAKYAVADDRAVVLTENWKPSGVGGHSSRGWGVVTNHSAVVRGLATTFARDAGWQDARRWRAVRDAVEPEPASPPANGSYPTRLAPERVAVERAELLRAPSGAGEGLVGLVDRANRSVDVLQMSIGDRRGRYVDALLRAADRGVEVRVLLSSAWYVREDNRRLVRWLNDRAARDDLPLAARLAEPGGRYEKVHAKGLVVDDAAAVGSLNWNVGATTRNREVVVVLHGDEPATYFRTAFARDWEGGRSRGVPVGFVVTAALGVAGAVAAGRKIRVA